MRAMKIWKTLPALALTAGCTVAHGASSGGDAITITVGYQSKTINTVTAGTLLRAQGYFERRLKRLGHYRVVWQDYDTGAPITAQMIAGKIDIGSMGDYPLLINGARGQSTGARTQLVSITGYNLRGALNGVVVARNSTARTLRDLKGKAVSASVGSAGHGTLVQALPKYGLNPAKDIRVENQQPSVGASALQAGNVAALAQFVAWPGVLVQKGQARLLYDGGALDVATFHGVVVRQKFAEQRSPVVEAFLQAQLDATAYLHQHPLQAAETVAEATGLAPEAVYLYNGAGGIATFDATVKPGLTAALAHDVPFLNSIGVLQAKIDLASFVNDTYLKKVYGPTYAADTASTANPAAVHGADEACHRNVTDPATAGEVWLTGEETTHPAATPACLLENIKAFQSAGKTVRAAYVPDALTGTRWFADQSVWVTGADRAPHPFSTPENAQTYLAAHPGAKPTTYAAALAAS